MKNRFLKQAAFLIVMLALAAGLVFATQTALTPVTPLGPYITGQPSSGALAFAFAACDASNGNSFPVTGREILLIENTDTMAAHTVTISSVADPIYNRTQDITAYSLAESTFASYSFRGGVSGWQQSDGTVHLACSNADIEFAVITTSN